jgi:hypothetical protein
LGTVAGTQVREEMSDRIVEFQGRIDALESVARGLTRDQIMSFPRAVRDAPKLAAWRADERYWYSGTAGVKLTAEEKAALGKLWTRMLAGLSFVVNHEEVETWVARQTLMGRLDRLVQPRQNLRLEGRATAVLERALGGEVWRGVVGIWNAFCAALLTDRLDPSLRSDLELIWRKVMGRSLEI